MATEQEMRATNEEATAMIGKYEQEFDLADERGGELRTLCQYVIISQMMLIAERTRANDATTMLQAAMSTAYLMGRRDGREKALAVLNAFRGK